MKKRIEPEPLRMDVATEGEGHSSWAVNSDARTTACYCVNLENAAYHTENILIGR